MILVCTPTIEVLGGFSGAVAPHLAYGGFTAHLSGGVTSLGGFTERTASSDESTVASHGGFNELATNTAHSFTSTCGMLQDVPVRFVSKGGMTGRCTVAAVFRGGATEKVTAPFRICGGAEERVFVPFQAGGGFTVVAAVHAAVDGGFASLVVPATALADTFSAWVFNTQKLGVGQYSNYPFNSMFKLGGNYFGVSETGIELLDGASDLGKPIPALVLSGVSNLGTDMRKVLTDAYLEVRSQGDMEVTLIYNERLAITQTTDLIDGKDGIYFKRLKMPRGADGTHIQVQVTNVDGADFDLQTIRLITQPKSRRL